MKSLIALALMVFSTPCFAQITVVGEGKVTAEPDMATVTLGVVAEDVSGTVASDKLNKQLNGVLNKLKEMKLADKDLCTVGYNLSPKYSYKEKEDAKLIGFVASSRIHVIVHDLKQLGAVVENSVNSGANTVSNVQFDVADSKKLFDKARELASADAKEKAKLYADNLGIKVGAVKTVHENSSYSPKAYDSSTTARGLSADSTPRFQAGERSFSVSVTVVYEVEKLPLLFKHDKHKRKKVPG